MIGDILYYGSAIIAGIFTGLGIHWLMRNWFP